MSGHTGARRLREPDDRLTRIADAMTDVLASHPETGGDVRAIVMLHDETRGGIAIAGYGEGDTAAAIADLLTYLQSIFEASGKSFKLLTDAPLPPGRGAGGPN